MVAQPTPLKQRKKRAETEELILRAAEKVFAEAGFGGATMQLIADVADLPKANVHYYFQTKEELYRQVVDQIFHIWLDAASAFDTAREPAGAISAYIDAKMDISRTHPEGSKVWASEVMHGAPIIQDYLEDTLIAWSRDRCARIQQWIDDGLMAPVEPQHLLNMIWATTQHYADFRHQVETLNGGAALDDAQWEAAKTSVKTIILRGLGMPLDRPDASA